MRPEPQPSEHGDDPGADERVEDSHGRGHQQAAGDDAAAGEAALVEPAGAVGAVGLGLPSRDRNVGQLSRQDLALARDACGPTRDSVLHPRAKNKPSVKDARSPQQVRGR